MSGERDINFLLNLYNDAYVKGESRPQESQNRIKSDVRRKNRHLLLSELIHESNNLSLTDSQVQLVRYFIDDFHDDFKELHRRASEETIILAFIFYTMKLENPSIRLESYRIFGTYGLTDHIFEIVLCRMMSHFIRKCPITPVESYKDHHDIINREGIR